jgi:hypothetical protein
MSWRLFAKQAAMTTACWCRPRAVPVWAAVCCCHDRTSSRMLALGAGSAASIATLSYCSAQASRSSPSGIGGSVGSDARIGLRVALEAEHRGWPRSRRGIARRDFLVLLSRLSVGKWETSGRVLGVGPFPLGRQPRLRGAAWGRSSRPCRAGSKHGDLSAMGQRSWHGTRGRRSILVYRRRPLEYPSRWRTCRQAQPTSRAQQRYG